MGSFSAVIQVLGAFTCTRRAWNMCLNWCSYDLLVYSKLRELCTNQLESSLQRTAYSMNVNGFSLGMSGFFWGFFPFQNKGKSVEYFVHVNISECFITLVHNNLQTITIFFMY